jgi:hypothetical protein
MRRAWIAALLLGVGLSVGPAGAEQKKDAAPPEAPMAKPGPEHALLARDVGTWDASLEMRMAPNDKPQVSQGVEQSRLLGGLWLITDFKATVMGQPFEGHGVMGFDPMKKKYVGTWVDSMSLGISPSEASYDPATRTLAGWMEGPDMTGKITRSRETTVWKNDDTRVFTIYSKSPEGVEFPGLQITYTRRK